MKFKVRGVKPRPIKGFHSGVHRRLLARGGKGKGMRRR